MTTIKISSLMQGALENQRSRLDEDRIKHLMGCFDDIEPVLVFESRGELILVDGHHRVEAARRLHLTTIEAIVEPGTREDATRYCVRPERIPWGLPGR